MPKRDGPAAFVVAFVLFSLLPRRQCAMITSMTARPMFFSALSLEQTILGTRGPEQLWTGTILGIPIGMPSRLALSRQAAAVGLLSIAANCVRARLASFDLAHA